MNITINGNGLRYRYVVQPMSNKYRFSGLIITLLLLAEMVKGQCIGNTFWNGATPAAGTLITSGTILGTVNVDLRSQGSFAAGRPIYSIGGSNYGGFSYQSLRLARGASFASGTYTSFKLQSPLDANYIHIMVSDIRGDGLNTEHQRVRGFLNGVAVPATFADPQNGATITGGNIITAPGTTTALIQASMRAFFTGPVDSIIVTATGLSDYVIVELLARCDILLPFEIIGFNGQHRQEQVILNWTSAAEEGVLGYEIQHSTDGIHWNKLGELPVLPKTGQTNAYSFTDISPETGKNYYRLKSVEINSPAYYSPIIIVQVPLKVSHQKVRIYPNPFKSAFSISLQPHNGEMCQVELLSAEGRVIHKWNTRQKEIMIPAGNWQKGIYLLRISNQSGEVSIHKIIRE